MIKVSCPIDECGDEYLKSRNDFVLKCLKIKEGHVFDYPKLFDHFKEIIKVEIIFYLIHGNYDVNFVIIQLYKSLFVIDIPIIKIGSLMRKNVPNRLVFVKNLSTIENEIHQLFEYKDTNGIDNIFYVIRTYDPKFYQAGQYKPYESLAFRSDENGKPLIDDPWNDGSINNTGSDLRETHYATYYDLHDVSYYEDMNNPCRIIGKSNNY